MYAAALRGLDSLQPLFALATRVYVSWQFLKSGWLKISSWDQTLSLFHDEYRVPLLPPTLAAVLGTAGELILPILLIVGLAGRLSALGLFALNAIAVISYAHVLLSKGSKRRSHSTTYGVSCCSFSWCTDRDRSRSTTCSAGNLVRSAATGIGPQESVIRYS